MLILLEPEAKLWASLSLPTLNSKLYGLLTLCKLSIQQWNSILACLCIHIYLSLLVLVYIIIIKFYFIIIIHFTFVVYIYLVMVYLSLSLVMFDSFLVCHPLPILCIYFTIRVVFFLSVSCVYCILYIIKDINTYLITYFTYIVCPKLPLPLNIKCKMF